MEQAMSKTIYTKDLENNRLLVEREFAAGVDRVWKAFTESAILDQWWAPRPWKAQTKSMNFAVGGHWLYSMNGPDGEQHWARADFKSITEAKGFEAEDCFCDESGKRSDSAPGMHWAVSFTAAGQTTKVRVVVTFASAEALNAIVEMGFQDGFASAHDNLDVLLAAGG